MTPASEGDRDYIEATLRAHLATSMFPLSNLARYGWESDEPRAMRFWVDRARDAVLGMSVEGFLMPQIPDGDMRQIPVAISGREVAGALGEATQVRSLLAAVGLDAWPSKMNEDEPQFLLDLADLGVPETQERVVAIRPEDRALALAWRTAYLEDLGAEHGEAAAALAAREIDDYIASDSHRFLVDAAGNRLAMTGFNARLADIVQIGGVYTPPDKRGRGLARRAVALHLAEARAAGATRATLFASGPAAIRAYEAIGFRRIGAFALVFFREPARVCA